MTIGVTVIAQHEYRVLPRPSVIVVHICLDLVNHLFCLGSSGDCKSPYTHIDLVELQIGSLSIVE